MTVPNLINDWGLNEVLRRRYNVQEGAPAPTMAMETFPVVEVGPFTPELEFLAGWRRCGSRGLISLNAGNPSQLFLSNPVDSRTIAVIDAVQVAYSGSDTELALYAGYLVGSLGAVQSVPLDTRFGLPAVTTISSLVCSGENAAAAAAARRAFDYMPVTTNQVDKIRPGPIILSPGYTLMLGTTANNVSLFASFRWRERRMLPTE